MSVSKALYISDCVFYTFLKFITVFFLRDVTLSGILKVTPTLPLSDSFQFLYNLMLQDILCINPKENLLNGKIKLLDMFALFEIICLWLFKSQYCIYMHLSCQHLISL